MTSRSNAEFWLQERYFGPAATCLACAAAAATSFPALQASFELHSEPAMSDIELDDLSQRPRAAEGTDELQKLGARRDAESVFYWAYTAAGV